MDSSGEDWRVEGFNQKGKKKKELRDEDNSVVIAGGEEWVVVEEGLGA